MRKTILLGSILLLSAVWALGQYDSPYNQSNGSQSSTDQTAIEGCLSGSDGNYTLTDKSGTTYQLTGDTAKLGNHVGHDMQLTGTSSTSSASATDSNADQPSSISGSASSPQTFNVTSFKHISKNCSAKP
jgi:hypothetical protein